MNREELLMVLDVNAPSPFPNGGKLIVHIDKDHLDILVKSHLALLDKWERVGKVGEEYIKELIEHRKNKSVDEYEFQQLTNKIAAVKELLRRLNNAE